VISLNEPAYRPDIDGLRAVAVLGVIFFHAGFPWVRGGYVGVDVFFVISGFLITGILLRELRQERLSLARFYERRARRILPALFVVLGVTLAACRLIMLPEDQRTAARSAVGVVAFAANFLFWRGVDFVDLTLINYFGQRLHEQPLIHTWSLGVEEQFYLLFPLTVLIAWRVGQRWVLPVLVSMTVASLAASAVLTPRSPGVAFYLLPARIWELLAGGLLAWRALDSRFGPPRRLVRETGAAIGLALIVIAMAIYDSTTPFPGLYALAPVVGAVLLIQFAPGSTIGRLLSWRPIVFIGLISYSAYLWHQPLFALARYVSLAGEMTSPVALTLCALTLVLATVTWRFVETPFRDRERVPTRALALGCAAGIAAIALPASLAAFGGDAGRRSPAQSGLVGQSILSLFSDCNVSLQLTRRLGLGCLLDPSSTAPPSLLVVGDSHAEAMFPAFAKISRATGAQGRLLQHFACSPLLDLPGERSADTPGCLQMREAALRFAAAGHIDSVFLVSRFAYAYMPNDVFARRLEQTINEYARRGATVYIVRQPPEQARFDRREYLRALLRHRLLGDDIAPVIQRQSSSRAEHEQVQAFVNGVFATYRDDPRVRLVDVTGVLCDDVTCPVGTEAGPHYRDDDHVNVAGAMLVSGAILGKMPRAD
jgi:peptidoglycan/LPS O-acetylase OafA/YrhL